MRTAICTHKCCGYHDIMHIISISSSGRIFGRSEKNWNDIGCVERFASTRWNMGASLSEWKMVLLGMLPGLAGRWRLVLGMDGWEFAVGDEFKSLLFDGLRMSVGWIATDDGVIKPNDVPQIWVKFTGAACWRVCVDVKMFSLCTSDSNVSLSC